MIVLALYKCYMILKAGQKKVARMAGAVVDFPFSRVVTVAFQNKSEQKRIAAQSTQEVCPLWGAVRHSV